MQIEVIHKIDLSDALKDLINKVFDKGGKAPADGSQPGGRTHTHVDLPVEPEAKQAKASPVKETPAKAPKAKAPAPAPEAVAVDPDTKSGNFITLDMVKEATTAKVRERKMPQVRTLFKEYGVETVVDLDEGQYADFLDKINEL